MRASPFDSYQSNAGEIPFMRKWLVRAFILSMLFHLGLIAFFRATELERFTPTTERLVPRAFSVKQVSVNPELLKDEEQEQPSPKRTADTPQIDIPLDKPSADQTMEELRATPLAPPAELAKPIVNEKPRLDSSNLKSLERLQENSSKAMETELSAVTSQLLKDKPKSSSHSLLKLADQASAATSGKSGPGAVSGFSNLDNLLGQAGGLKPGTAPVAMPGGALFGFNSAVLDDSAYDLLRKVGLLIRKNPHVTFSIEGHTDSFGDDESNLNLSGARATAVADWLINAMHVDASRIQTRGLGSSKLVVAPRPYDPASQASIEEEKRRQAPNRRVEIVFRFVR